MRHTFYVPSKSTRHRIASLALYRALIRNGSRIPLPKDVPVGGPRHPVAHIVRRRFETHCNYTSLRLIYAAMTSGYKFLTLFTKAQRGGSKEYNEVIGHLRHRRISSPRSKADSAANGPTKPPMITRTSPSFTPAKYKPTYTPHSDPAKRRIPLMGAASEGVPYLRFSKPQRPVVNQIIGRRRKHIVDVVDKVKDLEDFAAPGAALEDLWEDLVEKHIERETGEVSQAKDLEETYAWSVMVSRLWYEYKSQVLWDDITAKGEAMWDIVQAEKDHAAAVVAKDDIARNKLVVPLRTSQERGKKSIKIAKGRMMPVLQEAHGIAAKLRNRGEGRVLENQADPFTSPIWQELQRSFSGKMIAWLSKIKHHDPGLVAAKRRSVRRATEDQEDEGFADFLAAARSE